MNKETILCDYQQCPMKFRCAFFCPTMDKSKTLHYGSYPFEVRKGRCFQEKEPDVKIINFNKPTWDEN